jgi:sulfur-oxidizing protein SoxX
MKLTYLAPLAFAASSFAVNAEEIAPTQVAFDDGSVATSLTGVPGDAASGRNIVGNKGLGNCVACHQVTDLADVPWHGEIGPMLDGAGDRWSSMPR